MKTLYFIRHGQSKGNASLFEQQNEHTLLTSRGEQQAKEVASHIKQFPIQAIIASPFARAKATAHALSEELGLPVEHSELFVEHRRPGVQLRKKKLHPHWLWTQLHLSLFSRLSGYRHSDEETAEELLARAHQALAYLASRPEENIAVVTHGRFMRALHTAMTLGEGVTGRAFLSVTRGMRMRNTALMIAEQSENGWEVKAWNIDASHV